MNISPIEVAIAGHGHGHATGLSVGTAVHGLLDGLHREVSVALVHRLEESHLGVASQVTRPGHRTLRVA